MTVVLVTDGTQRAALAVVRSLGSAGHEVHVCSSRSRSLAGASTYAAAHWDVPDPLRDPDGFAEDLSLRTSEIGASVLIPVTEAAVTAVLEQPDRFRHLSVPMPTLASFQGISDKGRVAAVARKLDIRTPAELRIDSREELRLRDVDPSRFPVVVKPVRSVVESRGERLKTSVHHASDVRELEAVLDGIPAAAYPVLVQERVSGDGLGVFVLVWGGRLLAAFAHRRLREKPPSGGVSVLRESAALPSGLLERSLGLLDAFGWEGVAMVEYKGVAGSESPVLMEVNGRFWGSLQLAVDAGVDFPRLLVAAASGEEVAPVMTWQEGVRSRWFWGDVDHLLARVRTSREALHLPADAPGRIRALGSFLTGFAPGIRGEVLRREDPVPAWVETLDWFRRR